MFSAYSSNVIHQNPQNAQIVNVAENARVKRNHNMAKKLKESKTKKLTKKATKVIETAINKDIDTTKEHKLETVPAKLGTLTLKKNKSKNYDIIDKNKKIVAELQVPFQMGIYFMPTWAVWRPTLEDKSMLEDVFGSLDSALAFIQKKFSKK